MNHPDRDSWYTPRHLLDQLGKFDLDPANAEPDRFPTAAKHYGPAVDGLSQPWTGRVWLNPPFSNARPWIDRLAQHGNGIALVFCRSDAVWFQHAAQLASAMLMLKGRVSFTRPDGKLSRCPLGCVLLAFGAANAASLHTSGLAGVILTAHARAESERAA